MPEEIPTGTPLADPGPAPSEAAVEPEPPRPIAPTQPGERISVIDTLRGTALAGIITANMRGFAGPFDAYFNVDAVWKTPLDRWVQAFIDTFVQGKFITLFAFLFGVGFAVLGSRAEKRVPHFWRFYSRRLLGLLLIGVLHQLLFWWGDVLVTYALCGFLLIPFRRRKNKTILIWALSLMLVPLVGASGYAVYRQIRPLTAEKQAENKKKAAEAKQKGAVRLQENIRIYQTGSYPKIFQERLLHELKRANKFQVVAPLFILPLFLLGLWVWRRGIFQDPGAHLAELRKGLVYGALVGIPGNVAMTALGFALKGQDESGVTPAMIVMFTLRTFAVPALSLCYGCALVLLFQRETWRGILMPFSVIGRTALSNYLLQTVVCTTIFYGYGGGLFVQVNLAWLLLPTVVIYALQASLSAWWIGRYRFGPMEWVWRSMTYGQAQPMKRGPAPAELSSAA